MDRVSLLLGAGFANVQVSSRRGLLCASPMTDWNDSTRDPDESIDEPVVNAYLLVFEGTSSRMESLPLDGVVVIGRGDGAQVHLDDPSISRAHARISMCGGRAEIADLGSQNGTKVNRERIV